MTPALPELLALHRSGQLPAAEAGYRAVIAASGHADAMQLLASLLHQTGRSQEALDWLERALPQLAQRDAAESNRAAILLALGRHDDAIAAAEAVLARSPAHVGAARNRLLALLASARAQTDLLAQVALYRRYAELGGDDAEGWLEFGNALQNIGAADHAVAAFDRARDLAPAAAANASAALIAAHFDERADVASLNERARAVATLYRPVASTSVSSSTNRDCFGFYSPRFGDGPIASLVLPVLSALKARGVRLVLCSGCDHAADDAAPFRAVADVWLDVAALDDSAFARAVGDAGVAVMFDLCGHAPGNRLAAFAARLAPLQVSWGDWFCSTGLAQMDLFIGDPVTTPAVDDAQYRERVLRLPTSRFAFAGPVVANEAVGAAPAALRYASFNRLSKLTEATLACWAQILARQPAATLLLRSGGLEQASLQRHTAARFEAHGIDPARIEFEAFGSYRDTLRGYRRVTLALDPFPFNGCVTTFDALACAVPVVALHGRSLVARQSSALLHAIGCADWVASSASDYVERAVALAQMPANAEARARLAIPGRLPIFDVDTFSADVLSAVRTQQA